MINENCSSAVTFSDSKSSFSARYDKIIMSIILNCSIAVYKYGVQINDIKFQQIKTLWDTGANNTYVTKSLAFNLGLISNIDLHDGSWKFKTLVVYLQLPNRIILPIQVSFAEDCPGIDAIIGMNVISQGDFVIDNTTENTSLSFEMPLSHLASHSKAGSIAPILSKINGNDSIRSLRIEYTKVPDRIITDCFVSQIRKDGNDPKKRIKTVKAIFDTGSPVSLISESLSKELGLVSYGMDPVYSRKGKNGTYVYAVNLQIASLNFSIAVYQMENYPDFDFAIGMDVISKGYFSIKKSDSRTIVLFKMPINAK
jgi:hypothetical protein